MLHRSNYSHAVSKTDALSLLVVVFCSNSQHSYFLTFSFPAGLAWDWINEKLYWADLGVREIGVFDPSTGDRRVLFTIDSPGSPFAPRALIIDPTNA